MNDTAAAGQLLCTYTLLTSYHGCEIKSGWRPGYEVNTLYQWLELFGLSCDPMEHSLHTGIWL